MTGKLIPKSRIMRPKSSKTGRCYVSFGQNGAVFRYNSFDDIQLPLWLVPTIYKLNADKVLSSILADGPRSILRKSQSELGMRQSRLFGEHRLCITNYNNPAL